MSGWPDAELVALDALEPLSATVTHTDEHLTPPAIQVQRIGGTNDGVTDRPVLQTTCYGRTRTEAWQLDSDVQQLILSLSGGGVVTGEYVTDVLIDHTETVISGRQLPYDNPDIKTVVSEHQLDFRRQ